MKTESHPLDIPGFLKRKRGPGGEAGSGRAEAPRPSPKKPWNIPKGLTEAEYKRLRAPYDAIEAREKAERLAELRERYKDRPRVRRRRRKE